MNAEKLNHIAFEIKEDLEIYGIIEKLVALQASLKSLAAQPNNQTYQTKVGESRESLNEALEESGVNHFSPAWKQIIDEIGATNLLGVKLKKRIDRIFQNNTITPKLALEGINEIVEYVQSLNSNLNSLTDSLEFLNIDKDPLEPGQCEIGILIPREYFSNKLLELSKELKELHFILTTLSECLTGQKEDFEIRKVSSSDILVYLLAGIWFTEKFAKIVEYIINNYKSILEIRNLKNELEEKGVPKTNTSSIDEYANRLMEEKIEEKVNQLIKESNIKDEGRKNEVRNGLTIAMNKLANRIDQGFNIEIRVEPLEERTEGESEKEYNEVLELHDSIDEALQTLEFKKMEGKPILKLPESKRKLKKENDQ